MSDIHSEIAKEKGNLQNAFRSPSTQKANLGNVIEQPIRGEVPPTRKKGDFLKANVGWVYACMDAIADEVATINLRLYRTKGAKGEVEEVHDHDILDVIHRVNNFTTKLDFFRLTQQYLDAVGEAPWFVHMEQGVPRQLFLLRPDRLHILSGKNNELISGYEYEVSFGRRIKLETKEVVFNKYPSLTNEFRGMGTLEAAALTVDIDEYSEKFNLNYFYNSARPDLVLEAPKKLSKDQMGQLKRAVRAMYQGYDNAHKTLILEKDMKAKPLNITQKDMDFLNQQKFTRDKIFSIFRVPKAIVAVSDDVNRANAETAAYTFARWTIRPKMMRLIEQLNEFFIPLFPNSEGLYLDFDDPVPDNVEMNLSIYENALKNGWMTINEVRSAQGLEPLPEHADTPYIPGTLVPLGEKSQPAVPQRNIVSPAAKSAYIRDKEKIEKKERTEKIKKAVTNKLKPVIKNKLLEAARKKQEDEKISNFYEEQIKQADFFEPQLFDELQKYFSRQLDKVLAQLPKKAVEFNKIKLDEEKEANIGVRLFTPVVKEIVKEQGELALDLVGTDQDFDVDQPDVRKFIKENTFKFSFQITSETNKQLKKELDEAIKNGEGIPKIRKRILGVFDSIGKVRAEMIARSETARATSYATEAAYEQSGEVEAKRWILAPNPCEFCRELAANFNDVALGSDFLKQGTELTGADGGTMKIDYSNIQGPPLHPNCRCALIPILKS